MKNTQIDTRQSDRSCGEHTLLSTFRSTLFLAPLLLLCNSASAANLIFKSDFSKATIAPSYGCGAASSTSGEVKAICKQKVTNGGFPASFSGWGIDPNGLSEFLQLSYQYSNITNSNASNYFKNEIQTVTGPNGTPIKALYTWKNTGGTGSYNYATAQEGGNLYYRYWLKMPTDLPKLLTNGWTPVFSWKTAGDYRFEVYIYKNSAGTLYWHVQADNEANGGKPPSGQLIKFYEKNSTEPVPLGKWILVETWTHRSAGSDGRLAAAINGKIIADFKGPNMGYWKRRINRIAIIQNYGGQLNYRWVTGHEAWDAIPCGAFPCGNSASVATTVNNDPSVSTVTPTTSTGNLAPNPSFESDPAIDYFTHGTGTFSWAKDVAHTGKASLKIVSSQPNGAITRWLSRTKRITATAGETYTATAWLKSQNLAQNGMLTINFWNSSGQHLGSYNSPTQVRGTSNWTPVSVDAMAPLGSAYARVEFRLYGSGTLWVDDISLTTQ